jgi:hypothetical protein
MAACTCMWEMYSTIRTSKIGLGTLLSHFALPIALLCIKKSCPTSAISSSIQKHIRPVINLCHCLVRFRPCLVNLTSITMPRRYEPSSYEYLFSIPEFAQCREVFLRAGWGAFLSSLQGHDDSLSMQFAVGFDGKTIHVGCLIFEVT